MYPFQPQHHGYLFHLQTNGKTSGHHWFPTTTLTVLGVAAARSLVPPQAFGNTAHHDLVAQVIQPFTQEVPQFERWKASKARWILKNSSARSVFLLRVVTHFDHTYPDMMACLASHAGVLPLSQWPQRTIVFKFLVSLGGPFSSFEGSSHLLSGWKLWLVSPSVDM